ncbi:MAG TPA: hypothetical protein EYQ25_13360 [Planctomycetes bacterium]|nr:hypothetical protein [Planctomycetota bacterium]HIL38595.1 hypothetical protein [Planctomycetota bacterium]
MAEQVRLLGVGGRLGGAVRVPTSKSIAQRVVLLAMVARGRTRLKYLPDGEDVRSALGIALARGAVSDASLQTALELQGCPPGAGAGRDQRWAVGESGTLARCATALAALGLDPGGVTEIHPSGSLLTRRSPALMNALQSAGVCVDELGIRGGWPLRVRSLEPPEEILLENPSSSQEVSALLLALAAWPEPRVLRVSGVIPSLPYVHLTISVLNEFGTDVHLESLSALESCFHIKGQLQAPARTLTIEPDASATAVALAAGCLSTGEVWVEGLGPDSSQGDVRVIEYLKAFGCQAQEKQVAGRAALWACGVPTRGVDLNLSGEPDLAPVLVPLAAAAAKAGHGSRIQGLGTLDSKESPRLAGLVRGLEACGFEARAGASELVLDPGWNPVAGPLLDASGDHRMFFAWTLLGWVVPGLRIRGQEHVAKSWPDFLTDFASAGAEWVQF